MLPTINSRQRKAFLKKLPCVQKKTHLQVELAYDNGDVNMLTGEARVRGYYLGVQPCHTAADGSTSTTSLSGSCKLIQETKRYNETTLRKLTAQLSATTDPIEAKLVTTVLLKNALVLRS